MKRERMVRRDMNIRCVAVEMVLLMGFWAPAIYAATYSGGSGTSPDPYLISTPQDLVALSDIANSADWNKCFLMTNDVDMVGITGFTPIGNPDTYTSFSGIFDGAGHAVKNLTVNLPTQDNVALFGFIDGSSCQIKNLGIQGGAVSGRNRVGGLVGLSGPCTVTSCYSTATITGVSLVGGLIGWCSGGTTVTGCYATSAVTGGGQCVGGLVGYMRDGAAVTNCYATGPVAGGDLVGGLLGNNGLGSGSSGTVTGCYATGSVTGAGSYGYFGGLIGGNAGTVTACYARGGVTGSSPVGGLVGGNEGTVMGSVFDMETSGQAAGSGGKGLTSAQMKTLTVLQNEGWGAYNWVMADGQYPRLDWEGTGASPIPAPEPVTLSGSGTEADPYRVQTTEEFALLSWNVSILDRHILLTADLDFAGTTSQVPTHRSVKYVPRHRSVIA